MTALLLVVRVRSKLSNRKAFARGNALCQNQTVSANKRAMPFSPVGLHAL